MVVGYHVSRLQHWIGVDQIIDATEYSGRIKVLAEVRVSGSVLCQCIDETIAELDRSDASCTAVVAAFDTNGDPDIDGAIVIEVSR